MSTVYHRCSLELLRTVSPSSLLGCCFTAAPGLTRGGCCSVAIRGRIRHVDRHRVLCPNCNLLYEIFAVSRNILPWKLAISLATQNLSLDWPTFPQWKQHEAYTSEFFLPAYFCISAPFAHLDSFRSIMNHSCLTFKLDPSFHLPLEVMKEAKRRLIYHHQRLPDLYLYLNHKIAYDS